MLPTAMVTSSTAYVRLHGRDRDYWRREFDSAPGLDDYLYTAAELGQWKQRIEHVQAHAKTTFVILANPAAGRSVVNGLQLAALLGAEPDAHTPRRAVA